MNKLLQKKYFFNYQIIINFSSLGLYIGFYLTVRTQPNCRLD